MNGCTKVLQIRDKYKKINKNIEKQGAVSLSAEQKPHKKGRNPPIFVGGFQHHIGLLKIQ